VTTTTVAPTTTTEPETTTTIAPPVSTSTMAPPPTPPTSDATAGAGAQAQMISVTASGYDTSVATFDAYERANGGGWQLVFGPWKAHIGYGGMAPPGQKREGDGRTPSGTYGVGFFFGDQPEPAGINPSWNYRPASSCDVWDDDPSSVNYNQWVDTCSAGGASAGSSPEPMYNEPVYDYGAVISYNMSPVVSSPPMGSAIFLHVSDGGSTAGCVAIPQDDLLLVLKWLDPAQSPSVVLGVS
jgi:L,D-peptidoglycan transpeptidase YkuD (ErfK/YbiS/YcfS/YnhG family)